MSDDVLADIDMLSDVFFRIRQSGPEEFDFDNVAFILNCIDYLAGDHPSLDLRKRRPAHRRLTDIEMRTKRFEDEHDSQVRSDEQQKDTLLADAQSELNKAVDEIDKNPNLDEHQKRIQRRQAEETAQRKFDVAKAQIEGEFERKKYLARIKLEESRRTIQNRMRAWALILPPIPALLLGLFVLGARWSRERELTR